jgi:hypothetical protein
VVDELRQDGCRQREDLGAKVGGVVVHRLEDVRQAALLEVLDACIALLVGVVSKGHHAQEGLDELAQRVGGHRRLLQRSKSRIRFVPV